MSRCTCHSAAGVSARATQIEAGYWHSIAGVSRHRAGGKKLAERQCAMEDVAIGQAKDSLQIEWGETLPGDYACIESGRIGLHCVDHQVGDGFAMLIPGGTIRKLWCDVLAEQARDVRSGRGEAIVEHRGDEHLDNGGPAPPWLRQSR